MRPTLALLVLLLAAPGAAAKDRPPQWEAPYSTEPVALECNLGLPAGECPDVPGPNVQFGPFPPPERMDIAILDASGARVGAEVVFYGADGKESGRATLCERARRLPAPEGTTYVRILVDTVLTAQHCPHLLPPTTFGTVTLRLRD